ncbi:MAG: hypothetical protein ABJF01_10115 [bacterium]
MRRGDFGVDLVAVEAASMRELDSGHVLARPGTVYAIRLRNFGPLRCVSKVHLDGKAVTAGGLVLEPFSVVTLERPVDEAETGRFTVVAEGDERVFGPDGGRDNPKLGSIEAEFRRELPRDARDQFEYPTRSFPDRFAPPVPSTPHFPEAPTMPTPGRPMAPAEWTPATFSLREGNTPSMPEFSAIAPPTRDAVPRTPHPPSDLIERAAGTGLTGHSSQRFEPIVLGPLETEATTIRLRLVIGSEEALAAPRPLPNEQDADVPARPAARP